MIVNEKGTPSAKTVWVIYMLSEIENGKASTPELWFCATACTAHIQRTESSTIAKSGVKKIREAKKNNPKKA